MKINETQEHGKINSTERCYRHHCFLYFTVNYIIIESYNAVIKTSYISTILTNFTCTEIPRT
jgi:hypothetical protein